MAQCLLTIDKALGSPLGGKDPGLLQTDENNLWGEHKLQKWTKVMAVLSPHRLHPGTSTEEHS